MKAQARTKQSETKCRTYKHNSSRRRRRKRRRSRSNRKSQRRKNETSTQHNNIIRFFVLFVFFLFAFPSSSSSSSSSSLLRRLLRSFDPFICIHMVCIFAFVLLFFYPFLSASLAVMLVCLNFLEEVFSIVFYVFLSSHESEDLCCGFHMNRGFAFSLRFCSLMLIDVSVCRAWKSMWRSYIWLPHIASNVFSSFHKWGCSANICCTQLTELSLLVRHWLSAANVAKQSVLEIREQHCRQWGTQVTAERQQISNLPF